MRINVLNNARRKLMLHTALLLLAIALLTAIACGQSDSGRPERVELTPPPALQTSTTATTQSEAASTDAAEAVPQNVAQDETAAAAQTAEALLTDQRIVAAHNAVMGGIYERTLPSVVGLRVISSINLSQTVPGAPAGEVPSRSAGSGFVWDDNGHIVTNWHVVIDADRIVVVLSNGVQTDGEVVGLDTDADLAVVKITDDSVRPPAITLGDSDAIKPGHLALAIGNPFSRGFSMTSGIISAVGRTINASHSNFSVPRVIQHDAATNPGNSGGPLLNSSGEVVAINTQIISDTGAFSGIGLAVPINLAKLIVPAIIAEGSYEYPYIGIRGTTLYPDVAIAMGLPPETRGALVIAVGSDTAAQAAGMQPSDEITVVDGVEFPIGGDIITDIDGVTIRSMDDLLAYVVENTRPGDTAEFTIIRDGDVIKIDVTMHARPE